jgi:bifunctional non-homologous end joining protein LigD
MSTTVRHPSCFPNTCIQSVTLHCQQGSSDKVYILGIMRLEPLTSTTWSPSQNFAVVAHYGRRYGPLTVTHKGHFSTLVEATKKFNSLVREKSAKGYEHIQHAVIESVTTPEEGAQASAPTPAPYVPAPFVPSAPPRPRCVLLNAVSPDSVDSLLEAPEWALQPKIDGQRLLVEIAEDGTIRGFNRRGVEVTVPANIVEGLDGFPTGVTYDGEITGGADGQVFHIFDVVDENLTFQQRTEALERVFGRQEGRPPAGRLLTPYRQEALEGIVGQNGNGSVRLVRTYIDRWAKRESLKTLADANREGVVFKRLDARYTVGRPNSGGSYLKHKFVQSATCQVLRVNNQRSVEIGLVGPGALPSRSCGNVTIPANHEIPAVGQLVEVQYLYANPVVSDFSRGSATLYQPVYLGVRDDADGPDSFVGLKMKAV